MAVGHDKDHALNSTDDHLAGTDNTLLGTESGAIAEKSYGTGATADLIPQRDSQGQLNLPATDATGNQAVRFAQMESAINSAIDGLKVKAPVQTMNVIDDSILTPPVSPATGDAYVMPSGTLTGAWSGFSQGDLVEYDGAAWNLILAGTGSAPADGARVIVTGRGNGTAAGSFAGEANEIAEYVAGTGWTFSGTPEDGWSVLIIGNGAVGENERWVYDSGTTAWVQGAGAVPAHNDTTGIQGGAANDYYHFTQVQHDELVRYVADVSLAGVKPVDGDVSSWTNGDRGIGIGTSGRIYWMYKYSGSVKWVRLD